MSAEERIKQRIEGRKLAKELLDLLDSSGDNPLIFNADHPDMSSPQPMREAFVNQIASELGIEIGTEKLRKLTDAEARRFEEQIIGFGKHASLTYSEAPLEYLEWLSEKQMELSAYLRSDHAKKRKD